MALGLILGAEWKGLALTVGVGAVL
jgi:hypothetical protein